MPRPHPSIFSKHFYFYLSLPFHSSGQFLVYNSPELIRTSLLLSHQYTQNYCVRHRVNTGSHSCLLVPLLLPESICFYLIRSLELLQTTPRRYRRRVTLKCKATYGSRPSINCGFELNAFLPRLFLRWLRRRDTLVFEKRNNRTLGRGSFSFRKKKKKNMRY